MELAPTPIESPGSARAPGAWEGRPGGPYVEGDPAGPVPPGLTPEMRWPGPGNPPTGVPLRPREPGAGPWRFVAIGDYGSGGGAQARVAETLLGREPELVATLGDNVYDLGLEPEYWLRWDPADRFGRVRSTVPVLPSLGNHDVRLTTRAYFKRFPELQDARYYTYEHGGVRFVALDSNQSLADGSEQREWLEDVLAGAQDADHRVLYMHHPMLSSRERTGDRLWKDLEPVLQEGRVDLVMAGHEHHYERTRPLNEYGTVQVVHGGGGRELHDFETPPADWSAARVLGHGFLELEVTPDALVGRALLPDGSVADEFTLPAGGRAGAADAGAAAALVTGGSGPAAG